ncbi:MAG: 4Fe-4S binding protein [Candidatus Bathyarchaeota archaeon]|jgi:NAD-dependent dihydropyrimidine dehydrogenase PreA subunit|nr:4Fe-4S binding protein [Candidatus Bathyarchaeota archaeon]
MRALLKFDEEQTSQPITAQVILEQALPINILRADVKPAGGEILVEIPQDRFDEVVKAFQKRGVTVIVEKRLAIDGDKCIHCGACYSLCPVSVIRFEEDYTVTFDEDKCVACGLCIDACPTHALELL